MATRQEAEEESSFFGGSMITGLLLMLLALVGIIAIMVWIVQLPFVALLINIGLIALAAWILKGPFVALLAIIGFVAIILSALRWATTIDIRRHRTTTPDVGTALDVLNARYARGEIDQAEYREKRAALASSTGGENL
jgi:uncharacterized membrane protein